MAEQKEALKVALIVKKKWLTKIFDVCDPKVYEIRGTATHKRGRVGLIESGSGKVVGETILVNSFPVTYQDLEETREKHKIYGDIASVVKYKKPHAWHLEKTIKYKKPVPYTHKRGCVVWHKL